MKKHNLEKLFVLILAGTAFGARGISCGPCPDDTVTIPIMPPSSDGGVEDGGDLFTTECERRCSGGLSCEGMLLPLEDGGTIPAIQCTTAAECGAGRRPFGFEEVVHECAGETSDQRWLSEVAVLEEASIRAFRDLRRDLRSLGAPRSLLRAASRAAREETRHARRMRSIAKRRGARVPAPMVRPTETITLESLAKQNAVEGCVREAFGALVARYQAENAKDPEIRGVMARIASDEARHAALAFEVGAWLDKRLDKHTRARVAEARTAAARELGSSGRYSAALGLPDACASRALATALAHQLGLINRAS